MVHPRTDSGGELPDRAGDRGSALFGNHLPEVGRVRLKIGGAPTQRGGGSSKCGWAGKGIGPAINIKGDRNHRTQLQRHIIEVRVQLIAVVLLFPDKADCFAQVMREGAAESRPVIG